MLYEINYSYSLGRELRLIRFGHYVVTFDGHLLVGIDFAVVICTALGRFAEIHAV